LLKVACSGPGVSRTCNLLVTSPILYQLDHCTHCVLAESEAMKDERRHEDQVNMCARVT